MSTILSKNSNNQYQNTLNNTQDYSYPIGKVISTTISSTNNKNIRNPNNKLNDLRL